MRKTSLCLLLASILPLISCGNARDENSQLNSSPAVPSTAVKGGTAATACSTGAAPRFSYDSPSTLGRANFVSIAFNNSPNAAPCSITNQLLIDKGYRIRIKTIGIKGSYKLENSSYGFVTVQAGLSTVGSYSVKQDIRSGIANPFAKNDSIATATWTACSKVNGTSERLSIRPSLTISGSAAGKPAILSATLNEIKVTIEAERCTP